MHGVVECQLSGGEEVVVASGAAEVESAQRGAGGALLSFRESNRGNDFRCILWVLGIHEVDTYP